MKTINHLSVKALRELEEIGSYILQNTDTLLTRTMADATASIKSC